MLWFVGSQRVGHDLVTELKKKIGIGKRIQTNWGGGWLDWYLKSREIQLPSLSPHPSAYSLLI